MKKAKAIRSCLMASLMGCALVTTSHSQSRDIEAKRLSLDDGAGHTIRLSAPTSGYSGLGIFDFVLPVPASGITPGFVETGSLANQYLQWNNAGKYWQAVPGVSIGSGTQNVLTKWNGAGTAIINSAITEDGSTVSVTSRALLFQGSTGETPVSGSGIRMMWIPAKAAFRAGVATANEWDNANVGYGSFASGSTSLASGNSSTAIGYGTTASNAYSTAMGYGTTASNAYSTAMGFLTTASGPYSTAMGYSTIASGALSTAMGSNTTASGAASTAMGTNTFASGDYSTAMGSYVSTNGNSGSFIYGDATPFLLNGTAANQFMVRASGGTIFYSNATSTVGVSLDANANSWASISDSNKKANRLNIDGERVLAKLSNMWLGSWNYKTQDKNIRHYGPMAQEFFAAFGRDGVGVIGNDTTLATADVDGVTLIAVKALEARTAALQESNTELSQRVKSLEAVIRQMASSQEPAYHKARYRK